jgi:hypothetical protein
MWYEAFDFLVRRRPMAELERKSIPPEYQETPGPHGATNGLTPSSHRSVEATEGADEDRPFRGVHALRIPRPVIARLTGTLRLSELPRHKPTIVFDTGRQSRDAGDE